MDTMRRMYFEKSRMTATLQHWPGMLVPPPRDSTAAPNSRQAATVATTSSASQRQERPRWEAGDSWRHRWRTARAMRGRTGLHREPWRGAALRAQRALRSPHAANASPAAEFRIGKGEPLSIIRPRSTWVAAAVEFCPASVSVSRPVTTETNAVTARLTTTAGSAA